MKSRNLKRTKIVATISSLNCGEELLRKLYNAGMDVARLNTAHMTLDDAAMVVTNIRNVSDKIAIMIDTKGPNIRSSDMPEPLVLAEDEIVKVYSNQPPPEGEKSFQVNYAKFVNEVMPGMRIMVDDGEMELEILAKNKDFLECKAMVDGTVYPHKSINVPRAKLRAPALTQKDRDFIKFAVDNNLDFIAHSFVRNRDDVMAVQSILDTAESPILIIAKIENQEGVDNIESILDVAAGLMVARGDMGIEIPLEEVPIIQKRMIKECMERRKVVITATQMLQSMVDNPRPTRAEVSDVANAVLDGTDAVMLSGETAQGKYPVKTVEMMHRIIHETEMTAEEHFTRPEKVDGDDDPVITYMVKMAIQSGDALPVKAIISNTASGNSCRSIAAWRGITPIFALSYQPHVVRQLALSYGVYASHSKYIDSTNELIIKSIEQLIDEKRLEEGDLALLLSHHMTRGDASVCSIFRIGEDINP